MGLFKKKKVVEPMVESIEPAKQKIVNVYKCVGTRPNYRSFSWYNENKDHFGSSVSSPDYGLQLIEANRRFISSKPEPYYSDLLNMLEVSDISLEKLNLMMTTAEEYIGYSESTSYLREDIDKLSEMVGFDCWAHLNWVQRLVTINT